MQGTKRSWKDKQTKRFIKQIFIFLVVIKKEALQSVSKNPPCDGIKMREERRSGKENP